MWTLVEKMEKSIISTTSPAATLWVVVQWRVDVSNPNPYRHRHNLDQSQ